MIYCGPVFFGFVLGRAENAGPLYFHQKKAFRLVFFRISSKKLQVLRFFYKNLMFLGKSFFIIEV